MDAMTSVPSDISEPPRPFWLELPVADQESLLRLGTQCTFPVGAELLRQNAVSNHVLLLRSGCVKVVSNRDDGKRVVLGIRDAGEIIGEMSSMAGEPRSASVYAIRTVDAITVPAGRFNAFIRSHIDAAIALQCHMCARLREADRSRKSAGTDSIERRIAAVLLQLASRYGISEPHGGSILIDLPLSQEDLAGLALTSERTMGRILMRLRNERILVTGRRAILIKKPTSLRALLA
jgi:CRP-like cAMP-binding protein